MKYSIYMEGIMSPVGSNHEETVYAVTYIYRN